MGVGVDARVRGGARTDKVPRRAVGHGVQQAHEATGVAYRLAEPQYWLSEPTTVVGRHALKLGFPRSFEDFGRASEQKGVCGPWHKCEEV